MHIAESGAGPLVVLCHGFPESWYSWRHQLHALAEAGFHAVAPDMRGYGQTDRPEQLGGRFRSHQILQVRRPRIEAAGNLARRNARRAVAHEAMLGEMPDALDDFFPLVQSGEFTAQPGAARCR